MTSENVKTLTAEEQQFIQDYAKYTYLELCEKYNVCEQTINKWRIMYGLTKKKGRKPCTPKFKVEAE